MSPETCENRMSIAEVATALDVSTDEVSQWIEAGSVTPDAEGKFDFPQALRHSYNLDIRKIFGPRRSKTWLSSPNAFLNYRSPQDLIGTPEEDRVFDIIESLKYGGGE
jgi:hypothetical protein